MAENRTSLRDGKRPERVLAVNADGSINALPAGVTPGAAAPVFTLGSQAGAAAAISATVAGVAGKTSWITGFQVTGAGSTAGGVISITVTGILGGNWQFKLAIPAGVTLGVTPLQVAFPIPYPASAQNQAITVNVPSFGAGNTDAAVSVQGFQA